MRSLLRRCIEAVTQVLCYMKRDVEVTPRALNQDGLVKVNLGCGLAVAKGWTNVDASLNALVASWPSVFHRLLYRFSGANRYYSLFDYCALLQNHVFLHRDLSRGLSFPDQSVDYLYCSHFLEHLSRAADKRLALEVLLATRGLADDQKAGLGRSAVEAEVLGRGLEPAAVELGQRRTELGKGLGAGCGLTRISTSSPIRNS